MNFLLDPNLWYDDWDGSNPPITWNEEEKRYEFVHSSSPPHQTHSVGIYSDVFPEAGTLDFEYLVSDYSAYSHSDELRIQIISFDHSALEESTILDQVVVLGQPTRVTIETAPNHDYWIIFKYTSSGYYYGDFYYVDALITPIISEVSVSIPWWACVRPDPPEPCPVRANPAEEFVPFWDYDADFKFPLASSRKPMKIERPHGCVACGPNLTDADDPEPDPDPEIAYAYVSIGEGTLLFPFNFPPGLNEDEPLEVFLNESLVGGFSRDAGWGEGVWGGGIYDPKFNVPYTFRQGTWEHVCFLQDDFVIMRIALPQIHPTDTYSSSNLEYFAGSHPYDSNYQFDLLIDGASAWVKYELRRGGYAWVFSDNFPNGLEAQQAQFSQNGVEVTKNCFLWTKTHYPAVIANPSTGVISNIYPGFNGFNPEEQVSFSVSRGGITYNYTRTGANTYTPDVVPGPIESDPTNPWLMTFSGGSCFVDFYNYWA